MKILQLIYDLSSGGAEHFVVGLSNELSKNCSDEIYLITTNNDAVAERRHYYHSLDSKVKYISLGAKSGLSFKSLFRIVRCIKKINPDVVHAHTDLLCVLLPAIFFRRVKFFHTQHSLANACLSRKIFKILYKWIYKYYVHPIVISETCSKSYYNLYELDNQTVIYNGIEPLTTSVDFNKVKLEIESIKKKSKDKVLIHIARCSYEKNQILLFDSFKQLIEEGYHAVLIILGIGFDESNNNSIREFINLPYVHYCGVKKNVCDYLHCSDYFVLSSLYEGLPISLLEAISCGVIPVCTPAGGIPDIITREQFGYLSKSFSKEDFVSALKKAYKHYNSFNRNKLVEYYKNNFTMEICAKKYHDLFESIK